MRGKKIAVVGTGNVLMGDEGVGVELMRVLADKVKAGGSVEFIDAGTGFFTLVSDLDDYDAVVVIDAANGGGEPGSMYRFVVGENGGRSAGLGTGGHGAAGGNAAEASGIPEAAGFRRAAPISLHDFGVLESIAWERVRGRLRGKVVLFGIEPWSVELRLGLSEPLEAKLDQYAERILREIEAMLK